MPATPCYLMQAPPLFNPNTHHSHLRHSSNTRNIHRPDTRTRANTLHNTSSTHSKVTSHRPSNLHTRITRVVMASTAIINHIRYTEAAIHQQACWTA
jgi:hypothetical protein